VRILSLSLKNFRCFPAYAVPINNPFVVIAGSNGSGKSTLLEALHYACYLRSFRTGLAKELIAFEQEALFLDLVVSRQEDNTESPDTITIGFSGNQRSVKINGKKVVSYKELLDTYRVITVTEDDLMLIKGGPDARRHFIDAAVVLHDPGYIQVIKEHKAILVQRNALLFSQANLNLSYEIWTEKLWGVSSRMATKRTELLKNLSREVTLLSKKFFSPEIEVELTYQSKKAASHNSWEIFSRGLPALYADEVRQRRSLFGAHLDDFSLFFRGASLQRYASRGQQKLIVLLIKIAQYRCLGLPTIFLLDDFITDLDSRVIQTLLELLISLETQIIIATPHLDPAFVEKLAPCKPLYISL